MSEAAKLERRIILAVTGASGSIYAERLLNLLVARVPRVYVIATDAAKQVIRHELGRSNTEVSLGDVCEGQVPEALRSTLRVFGVDDLFAPIASGSSAATDMVVVPCSMGTMARIATGMSANLLERAADVMLKQRRRLIICPRETPLNSIHLRNMLTLSDMGAVIVPPMPAFYQQPKSVDDMVDFVVGRLLEALDLSHDLYSPWNARMR